MKRSDSSTIRVERRQGLALRGFGEILDRRNDVTHRLLEVGLQIAMPHNSFVGIEINQNQGPGLKQANLRDDGPLQGHHDRPRSNALKSQLNSRHEWLLP